MSVEMLEDVIRTNVIEPYVLKVEVISDSSNGLDIETQAESLERELKDKKTDDKAIEKTIIEMRLAVALYYNLTGNSEDAAYQISRAGGTARYYDTELGAILAVIAAVELKGVKEKNGNHKKKLLNEACLNLILATEGYCKLEKIELAEPYFDDFLDIAREIEFKIQYRIFRMALENIAKQLPNKVRDYYCIPFKGLGDVIKPHGFKVDVTSKDVEIKYFQNNAELLEGRLKKSGDRQAGKTSIGMRLSAALSHYYANHHEDAAYQFARGRGTARHYNQELTAILAVASAVEFKEASKNSTHKRKLLVESCLNFMFAVEAYCEIDKIDQARQYFNDFLNIAPDIKFVPHGAGIKRVLEKIRMKLPEEVEGYKQMSAGWK